MSYANKTWIETQFQNFATRIGIVFAKKTDVPSKVSDLTNDSGFVTGAVDNLVNYYKKSDTYTKTEIASLIANVSTMSFEVVEVLPVENISANTIYLVPIEGASSGNAYTEYVYIRGKWEVIGQTDVNLSGYVTAEQLNTALADYLEKTDVETENIDFSTYFSGSESA